MTRPMYAPEPQGVRSASSSAFEWEARRAQMTDDRSPFDRERDRVIDQAARRYITEREKTARLAEIDDAERAAERHTQRQSERAKDKKRGR